MKFNLNKYQEAAGLILEKPHSAYDLEQKSHELMNEDGYSIRHILVNGMIGSGTKVHRFNATVAEKGDEQHILRAGSHCGSAKFSRGGYSTLAVLADGISVTCKKCNH